MAKKELAGFKRCWAYLRRHETKLRARESGKFDDDQWWRFGRNQNIDKQELPKLLVPRLLVRLFASVDPSGDFCIDNVDVGGILVGKDWNLYYLLGVLNSNACNFVWRLTAKPFRGGYLAANKQFIAPLPIPETREQDEVAELARRLTELHTKRLTVRAGVHRRLITDLPPSDSAPGSPIPGKLPRKLVDFDAQSMRSVLGAMEKFAKRRLRPQERTEWDEYIERETTTLGGIKNEIRMAESALNERVYELYGLTEEQIAFIERDAHG